jgi:hypothetical protein
LEITPPRETGLGGGVGIVVGGYRRDDLIWWLPFGLFLVRGTVFGRRIASLAPWLCVAIHATALILMVVWLQPGTLIASEPLVRAAYVAGHVMEWTIGWSMWILAAVSLVGFYAWWGCRLAVRQRGTQLPGRQSAARHTNIAIVAVVLTAFGMICDFSGEGSLILLLVDCIANARDGSLGTLEFARTARIERAFTLLSAGAANGLYTVGGIMLTLITPDLPKWVRAAMWVTWIAGVGMTLAAVANNLSGMVLTTALLFPPFLVWVAWMGVRWRSS